MSSQSTPCLDDCPYHVLAMQASTRNTLSSCLVTSLNSLLAAERYLKDFEMPGWNPMNVNNVKQQIENAEKAKRKSASDLKYINDTIKEGCPNCRVRFNETYQNLLPAQPEFHQEYTQQMDFTLLGLVPIPKPNTQEI